jgi:hypothetical protein
VLSFASPGYLVAAIVAAAGLVAAHFIVRRQPRAMILPTASFVPDAPVLTTGWARLPADLLLLALRSLCVLLAGLALAGPFLRDRAEGTIKVVLAERSNAVADSAEVSDSVAAVLAAGDTVIRYGGERGSLSSALVAAARAASRLRERADSVELVVISAFAAEQMDAATERIRREWPGRARLVRVSQASEPDVRTRPELVGDNDDPLAVALLLAAPMTAAESRVVRGELRAADSAWVNGATGRVLVHWPVVAAPAGFVAVATEDQSGGFLVGDRAVLASFGRRWQHVAGLGEPVAWWMDGAVAATETGLGEGCVRSVAIPVPDAGDFVLRPDFHAALRALLGPCLGKAAGPPLPPSALVMLEGTGALAAGDAFARADREASPWAKWLLMAALACALLELLVRRTRLPVSADSGASSGDSPARKAA